MKARIAKSSVVARSIGAAIGLILGVVFARKLGTNVATAAPPQRSMIVAARKWNFGNVTSRVGFQCCYF